MEYLYIHEQRSASSTYTPNKTVDSLTSGRTTLNMGFFIYRLTASAEIQADDFIQYAYRGLKKNNKCKLLCVSFVLYIHLLCTYIQCTHITLFQIIV